MTSYNGASIFVYGSQRLSGFLLAVNDFNEKYGIANNITVKYAVRDGHNTFLTTAVATASLVTTAFPQFGGLQAIVGGGANPQAQAIADTSAEFALPHLSFGASSSAFAHSSLYPYFSRSTITIHMFFLCLLFYFHVIT